MACAKCSRTDLKVRACTGCHSVKYCSLACQTEDWPEHRKTCLTPQGAATVVPIMAAQSASDVENCMSATPRNATRGVPMAWLNAIMFSDDKSEAQLEARLRFVVYVPSLSVSAIDTVVDMCRKTCVLHAFNTRGTVDKKTRWLIGHSSDQKWTAKEKFSTALFQSIDNSELNRDALALAEGIMYKRSKPPGHPRTVTTANNRQCVFIYYDNGVTGTFFDVTLSDDATSGHTFVPLPQARPSRACVVCDEVGNKHCTGCKDVRYCSEKCQRVHWRGGHKDVCAGKREADPEGEV